MSLSISALRGYSATSSLIPTFPLAVLSVTSHPNSQVQTLISRTFSLEKGIDNSGVDGQTTPRPQSMEPNGENGDKVPPHGSLASLEEVDGLIEPEKKKNKARKAKKVKMDEVSSFAPYSMAKLMSRISRSNTTPSEKSAMPRG
jgi:hypothetical protein